MAWWGARRGGVCQRGSEELGGSVGVEGRACGCSSSRHPLCL